MEPSLYGVIGVLFTAITGMGGVVAYLFKKVLAADHGHARCREDLSAVRSELSTVKAEMDRMTIESVLDAIIVADDAGIIRQWNPPATMLFGWGMMEVLGQPITMLMGAEAMVEHNKGWTAWLNDKRPPKHGPYEAVAKHREGILFPVLITLAAWQEGGKSFCIARIRKRLADTPSKGT